MLTGDKQETAVNISHSCGHFKQGMDIMFVTQKKTIDEVDTALIECEAKWVLLFNCFVVDSVLPLLL